MSQLGFLTRQFCTKLKNDFVVEPRTWTKEEWSICWWDKTFSATPKIFFDQSVRISQSTTVLSLISDSQECGGATK